MSDFCLNGYMSMVYVSGNSGNPHTIPSSSPIDTVDMVVELPIGGTGGEGEHSYA